MDLTNENMKLINNLKSMKAEVEEKMNEALEKYKQALNIVESNKPSTQPSKQSQENLDEFMMSSLIMSVPSSVCFS